MCCQGNVYQRPWQAEQCPDLYLRKAFASSTAHQKNTPYGAVERYPLGSWNLLHYEKRRKYGHYRSELESSLSPNARMYTCEACLRRSWRRSRSTADQPDPGRHACQGLRLFRCRPCLRLPLQCTYQHFCVYLLAPGRCNVLMSANCDSVITIGSI